jgi:predicted acetylornithine/succinylornithine family transaminase
VRGKGTYVWDTDGRQYLDFLAGISVNNLGHCPERVVQAISRQAAQLMHCSNLYLIPAQAELAQKLCSLSFAERAFFANSGAEVNEGAIKLARLYSKKKSGDNRFEIVTFRNSFHGRTLATLTATGQEKIQKGYEPLVEGFRYADFNDMKSVMSAVTDRTCAIMIEPVQGEGGIRPATPEFLKSLRALCNERGLLLIYDEIQCGMGRCGELFAYQVAGVEPDIMTIAKALGNGFPIGALLARASVAEVFEPGSHGSTFGGNPMACAAALAVLEEFELSHVLTRVKSTGSYFFRILRERLSSLAIVKEIRGLGLMVGIELKIPGSDIVKACSENGLLINCTMGNVLRILPPLIVSEQECESAVGIIESSLKAAGNSNCSESVQKAELSGGRQ